MGKKILVIGQGAREHALVWKLLASPAVEKIFAAPGNAGIAEVADCYDIAATDVKELARLAEIKGIDLTVVGPEAPLMEGIVDIFEKRGLRVFGPSKSAARLEGSKVFSKDLMKKYNIPTADYEVFADYDEAAGYVREMDAPLVVKADGLAAGKGVVVARDQAEALAALETIMKQRAFGRAGDRVVIEECLEGEEVSVFAFCDGEHVTPMVAAQDHKRVFDGDQGPNTGGMGAYSPAPIYTDELHKTVMEEIMVPVSRALAQEGCPYKGVLYTGLMITSNGPKVLEFNARFGDPEAQVILPLLEGDLLPILEAVADGSLNRVPVKFKNEACVCVVLASGGYPGKYPVGLPISGLNEVSPDIIIFHAGTRRDGASVVTDGGRVLSVVGIADDVKSALVRVYQEIPKISFAGMHYRKDIGHRALK